MQAGVDALFENGPQRTRTMTEAEFTRQFITMLGDLVVLIPLCLRLSRRRGVTAAVRYPSIANLQLIPEEVLALAARGGIRSLRLEHNLGFVRGNNHGLAHSQPGSDILLLNNDMEITQSDWLQRLRRSAHSAPGIGIVGCRLQMPGRRLASQGIQCLLTAAVAYDGRRFGILQKVSKLAALVGRIQRMEHEACAQARQIQTQTFRGLLDLHRNTIAARNAECRERRRHPPG